MKRRALPWDPVSKMFTETGHTVPRLLDPEEEQLAREFEAKPTSQQDDFLLYMSAAAAFKNW